MILRINYPSDKQKVIEYIQKLPDKKYLVNIELKREQRSPAQNRVYWLWIACICEETGNSKNKVHLELGTQFLPLKSGKMGNEPVSTTSLDTSQFKKYLDEVNLWANEFLGIILPNPEDKYWTEFYETYKDRV
jgi:hypothetical protein